MQKGLGAATVFINSVEGQDLSAFGPFLVLFYSMRARLYTEMDAESGGNSHADSARADIQKAQAAVDKYYNDLSGVQKLSIDISISNAISSEAKVRSDAIDDILKFLKTVYRTSISISIGWRVLSALIGALLWGLATLMFLRGGDASGPGPLTYVAFLMLVALFLAAMRGWDWHSEYKFGTYGKFFKFISLIGIMSTVVGNVFVFYWTGRFVVRLFAER